MELPEGSYLLSEDNQLMLLPEPAPIYQIKQPEFEIHQEEVATYAAATKEPQGVKEPVNVIKDKTFVPETQLEEENLKQLKEHVNQLELDKQKLTAKLEYSNELLLELYNSKS